MVAKKDVGDCEGEQCDSEYVYLLTKERRDHNSKQRTWIIASSASQHMSYDRNAFVQYRTVDEFSVEMVDKSIASVIGPWDVTVPILCNGTKKECMLKHVLNVPELRFSLVSVNQLTSRGLKVVFAGTTVETLSESSAIAFGT